MAIGLMALRAALKEAGASDEAADKAAQEVAEFENRFDAIERRLSKVEADLLLLKWMIGVNTALTLIVLGKLFHG
jgi:hypothetical protein